MGDLAYLMGTLITLIFPLKVISHGLANLLVSSKCKQILFNPFVRSSNMG